MLPFPPLPHFTVRNFDAVMYLTHLRDGSANDEPSFFAHGEEVVA